MSVHCIHIYNYHWRYYFSRLRGSIQKTIYMLAKDFFSYRRLSRLAHIEGARPFSHLQFLDPREVCITRAYNRKPLTNKANILFIGITMDLRYGV